MGAILDGKTEDQRKAEAEALREAARQHARDAHESFERCDNDGFLSQWASGVNETVRQAEADLVEAGGLMETRALFDLDGNLVSTHNFLRKNQYSYSEDEVWRMSDDFVAKGGKRFVTLSLARKGQTRYNNDAKKGVRIGTIRVRGYVAVRGSYNAARGVTLPNIDDLKNGDFDIVTVDRGVGRDY